MPPRISFGWTWPALVAGRKTVTRRKWKDVHASKFKAWDRVECLDKDARAGGKVVALVQLTQDPHFELPLDIGDDEYEAEGFGYFEEHPDKLPAGGKWKRMDRAVFEHWRTYEMDPHFWVIRFRLVAVRENGAWKPVGKEASSGAGDETEIKPQRSGCSTAAGSD